MSLGIRKARFLNSGSFPYLLSDCGQLTLSFTFSIWQMEKASIYLRGSLWWGNDVNDPTRTSVTHKHSIDNSPLPSRASITLCLVCWVSCMQYLSLQPDLKLESRHCVNHFLHFLFKVMHFSDYKYHRKLIYYRKHNITNYLTQKESSITPSPLHFPKQNCCRVWSIFLQFSPPPQFF